MSEQGNWWHRRDDAARRKQRKETAETAIKLSLGDKETEKARRDQLVDRNASLKVEKEGDRDMPVQKK